MMALVGLVTGLLLGFALQGAGFLRKSGIVDMLSLRDFHLIKVLFLAIGVGALATYFSVDLSYLRQFVKPLHLGVLVGGVVFGVGMAMAGHCPGTALIAIGRGSIRGWAAFIGGLFGVFVYGILYPYLRPLLDIGRLERYTLYDVAPIGLPIVLLAFTAFAGLAVLLAVFKK